jgi:hypothetical protein
MLGLINQLAIARASGGVGGARGQRNNFLLALFQIIENSAFSNAGIIL